MSPRGVIRQPSQYRGIMGTTFDPLEERELSDGGLACPYVAEFSIPISSCVGRILVWEASGRKRLRICAGEYNPDTGEGCPHFTASVEVLVRVQEEKQQRAEHLGGNRCLVCNTPCQGSRCRAHNAVFQNAKWRKQNQGK